MPIQFDWDNADQTIIRFIATDPWNWNDFHKTMRIASFRLDMVDHPVEMVIDLRQSSKLPAGAVGHIRSLGNLAHPNARKRLLIIGLDADVAGTLGGADGIFQHKDRLLRFVDSDDEVQAVLMEWLQV